MASDDVGLSPVPFLIIIPNTNAILIIRKRTNYLFLRQLPAFQGRTITLRCWITQTSLVQKNVFIFYFWHPIYARTTRYERLFCLKAKNGLIITIIHAWNSNQSNREVIQVLPIFIILRPRPRTYASTSPLLLLQLHQQQQLLSIINIINSTNHHPQHAKLQILLQHLTSHAAYERSGGPPKRPAAKRPCKYIPSVCFPSKLLLLIILVPDYYVRASY